LFLKKLLRLKKKNKENQTKLQTLILKPQALQLQQQELGKDIQNHWRNYKSKGKAIMGYAREEA
jgi:hypothetical protein